MAGYTFNQLIDFTRTSAATYVDSTGKIVPTAASRNLLTYTQEFDNASWSKTNANAYPFDPATASVGANVVTSGDFASATGWNASAGWAIGSGVATATATSSSLYGGFTAVSGQWYKVTFDCTITSGTLLVAIGLGTAASFTTSGTKTVYLQSGSSVSRGIEFYGGSVSGTVDNVVAQPVTIGLLAPDGTLTADTVTAISGASIHRVISSVATIAVGTSCVHSVYVKAGTHNFVQIHDGASAIYFANFNLSTGAVGTSANCTASITAVGDGWYRCAIIFTVAIANPVFCLALISSASAVRNESWTAAGTETIYAWGAQIETGSTATTYTRNFGGLYPARFDYDPVTLAPKGLLIEEQRTNLLLRSEEFDNAAWSKINGSVTANATTSPDGTVDADLFIPDTTNNQHRIDQTPVSSAVAQVFSVFVKSSGYTWIALRVGSVGRSFNIVNGTVGTQGAMTGTITPFGNGWYRCAIAVPSPLANDICRINVENADGIAGTFAGDGTSGVFLWGAQLEAGSFATSYIPTVASQVTRTADVAAINAPNFASWYNQSEGTMLVDCAPIAVVGDIAFSVSSSVGFNNSIYALTDNAYQFAVANGSVVQAAPDGGTVTANASNKIAGAYKVNDFAVSLNGGAAATDTSGTLPTVDRAVIGGLENDTSNRFNGHIRSIRYYPTRLTNAQLQALTA